MKATWNTFHKVCQWTQHSASNGYLDQKSISRILTKAAVTQKKVQVGFLSLSCPSLNYLWPQTYLHARFKEFRLYPHEI
jgi:hypothetical protein